MFYSCDRNADVPVNNIVPSGTFPVHHRWFVVLMFCWSNGIFFVSSLAVMTHSVWVGVSVDVFQWYIRPDDKNTSCDEMKLSCRSNGGARNFVCKIQNHIWFGSSGFWQKKEIIVSETFRMVQDIFSVVIVPRPGAFTFLGNMFSSEEEWIWYYWSELK